MTAVNLLCTLCDTTLSASNESRIAYSHLKGAACSKVKTDPEGPEVKEMELLCASVDESQFGNALVDTVLVQ